MREKQRIGGIKMRISKNVDKWPLRCPICTSGRLVDVTNAIAPDNILLFYGAEVVKGQLASKCPKCKHQIGITIKLKTG